MNYSDVLVPALDAFPVGLVAGCCFAVTVALAVVKIVGRLASGDLPPLQVVGSHLCRSCRSRIATLPCPNCGDFGE